MRVRIISEEAFLYLKAQGKAFGQVWEAYLFSKGRAIDIVVSQMIDAKKRVRIKRQLRKAGFDPPVNAPTSFLRRMRRDKLG